MILFYRNVFSIAIDALGRENGMEEIVKLLNEVGKSHARRKIPKKAFNVKLCFFISTLYIFINTIFYF